jgi:hypothetical protein
MDNDDEQRRVGPPLKVCRSKTATFLKVKALGSFETSGTMTQIRERHILEGRSPQSNKKDSYAYHISFPTESLVINK